MSEHQKPSKKQSNLFNIFLNQIKSEKEKQNLEKPEKRSFKDEIERRYRLSDFNKKYIFPRNISQSSNDSSLDSIKEIGIYNLSKQIKIQKKNTQCLLEMIQRRHQEELPNENIDFIRKIQLKRDEIQKKLKKEMSNYIENNRKNIKTPLTMRSIQEKNDSSRLFTQKYQPFLGKTSLEFNINRKNIDKLSVKKDRNISSSSFRNKEISSPKIISKNKENKLEQKNLTDRESTNSNFYKKMQESLMLKLRNTGYKISESMNISKKNILDDKLSEFFKRNDNKKIVKKQNPILKKQIKGFSNNPSFNSSNSISSRLGNTVGVI